MTARPVRRTFATALSACCALLALACATAATPLPNVELPANLELVVAAAPPLVRYPLMGCLDERGRLYIGDAAGLNLRQKDLEAQLPNRVLRLEDTDGDGVFDRQTIFADKMTFPQGAAWLDGSLYVASPPGIWKLTDTNGDGVADQREMIVGGFDYDGNAADVHGPFVHPTDGRLYWCHGRKGHHVVQKDGTLVHEGKASGIWSCRPDGSDVQWHSLGCMDNPVEVDFTPEGRMVGVVNLYYNQPRGDTLVHWLYGGVYDRPDQLSVIAGLPRTLEHVPIVHNFGHVAVSGFTRYRSGILNAAWRDNLFITYFNTQKLVRVELTPDGATYRATEHEFLKLNDPDAHFTDVIEDPTDGSLLVLNTGGWFRIGCPSSIAEKPDFRGAIYRVQQKGATRAATSRAVAVAKPKPVSPAALSGVTPRALLDASKPFARLGAFEALAQTKHVTAAQRDALRQALGEALEPTLEHAVMFAAIATRAFEVDALRAAASPVLTRRLLVILSQTAAEGAAQDVVLDAARREVDAADAALADTAIRVLAHFPRALERWADDFKARIAEGQLSPGVLRVVAELVGSQLAQPAAQSLLTAMLKRDAADVRHAAWQILSQQSGAISNAEWFAPLERSLASAAREAKGDLPLLLDGIGKLATKQFDRPLRALIEDKGQPLPIRMRALAALSHANEPLNAEAFALLLEVLRDGPSTTAKVEAARLLTRVRLSKEQLATLAPLLGSVGAVELTEVLKLGRRLDPVTSERWAASVVRSPVFSSFEESAIRSAFSTLSPETYEQILGPAARAAAAEQDAKRRALGRLAAAAAQGRPGEGRQAFAGSACIACHRAGELGRVLGPDLTHIGRIRQPRDLLESILFPSATIARDFETYVVETSDGQSFTGTIRGDTPEGLKLVELSGEERIIPQRQIVGRSALPTSLMPAGLEQSLSEQQLLDMVAWLVSLK